MQQIKGRSLSLDEANFSLEKIKHQTPYCIQQADEYSYELTVEACCVIPISFILDFGGSYHNDPFPSPGLRPSCVLDDNSCHSTLGKQQAN
jgi:hypothetical protein